MVTKFRIRKTQRTRTLPDGGKYLRERFIVDYLQDGAWRELPNEFSDRTQARRAGQDLVNGTYQGQTSFKPTYLDGR